MIYLFNSGFRPLYRNNILNTLYVPNGFVIEFRYRIKDEESYVHPSLKNQLNKATKDEKVVIIFVDRYANNGYIYHPIRLGRFVSFREEDQRLYLSVELVEFIYPKNLNSFNLNDRLPLEQSGSPRLTNNDPKAKNDGYYALIGDDIFKSESDFYFGSYAWPYVVESLSRTTVFDSKPENPIVFLRANIYEQKRNKIVIPSKANPSRFNLSRTEQYDFQLNYYFPIQSTDPTITIEGEIITGDSPFRIVGENCILIDSISNSTKTSFMARKYPEETFGRIEIKLPETITSANAVLDIKIVDSHLFWLLITSLVIVFSGMGVIVGTDFSAIDPLNVKNLFHNLWPNLIAALLQACILTLLLRIFGKRVL